MRFGRERSDVGAWAKPTDRRAARASCRDRGRTKVRPYDWRAVLGGTSSALRLTVCVSQFSVSVARRFPASGRQPCRLGGVPTLSVASAQRTMSARIRPVPEPEVDSDVARAQVARSPCAPGARMVGCPSRTRPTRPPMPKRFALTPPRAPRASAGRPGLVVQGAGQVRCCSSRGHRACRRCRCRRRPPRGQPPVAERVARDVAHLDKLRPPSSREQEIALTIGAASLAAIRRW